MAYPSSSKNLVTVERLSSVIGGSNGTSGLWGKTKALVADKADKSATVSNVAWSSNKLTKTINGTTTDVVTAATIKTAMSLTKSDVGLGDVDNTSDATKKTNFTGSIASENTGFVTGDAAYTALNGKQDTITFDGTYSASTNKAATVSTVTNAIAALDVSAIAGAASKTLTSISETDGKISATYSNIAIAESQVTNLTTDLAAKAPLASPTFTGTPEAPTAAVGTNTTQIATTAFVKTAIDNSIETADAMIYKGTIDGGSTGAYGALTAAASRGWTYKVSTAGKIDGVAVEVGDMLICNTDSTAAATSSDYATIAANWDFIQANIDGAVTGPASSADAHVAVFDGTGGKVIKDSGFTIGKSVPSNAAFTDVSVTSSANHYTPSTASGSDKSASASGATAAWSIDVVKGVTLNTDGKGHVTGISVTSGKIPANPNTDTKVKATAKTDNVNYKILATASASPTSGDATEAVYDADITLNPSTNTIAANISGNAATATNATNATSANTASDYAAGGGIATALSGKAASSHTHGNLTNGGAITATGVTIANGDALTIVDSSASGALVKSSITFDGSTATQALTKAGTWETFNNYTHPTTSGNKHIPSGGSSGNVLTWSSDGTATWGNLTPAQCGVYYVADNSASSPIKSYSIDNYNSAAGVILVVTFKKAVPKNTIITINDTYSMGIKYRGSNITAGIINAGDTVTFMYTGENGLAVLSIDSCEQEMTTTEVDDLLAALT